MATDPLAEARELLASVHWQIEQHEKEHGARAEHLTVELNPDTLEDWRDALAALVAHAERQGREVVVLRAVAEAARHLPAAYTWRLISPEHRSASAFSDAERTLFAALDALAAADAGRGAGEG